MKVNRRTIIGAIAFRGFFTIAAIGITLVLSRVLGVEEFGRYSWLISIAFFSAGFAQAAGNNLVVRETSKCDGRAVPIEILQRVGVISVFTTAAIAMIGYFTFSHDVSPALAGMLFLFAMGHVGLVFMSAALRGAGNTKMGQIPELIIRPLLFLLAIAVFLALGNALSAEAAIALSISVYFAVLLYAALKLRDVLSSRQVTPSEVINPDWRNSFIRLGLVGWLAIGNSQLLIILTGALADFSETGLFRVASQAIVIMGLGLVALETVQAPSFAKAHKADDQRALHDLLQQSCRIGFFMAALLSVALYLGGPTILALFFGAGYQEAFPALMVLALAFTGSTIFGNARVLMIATHNEDKLIIGNGVSLVISVAAAIALIPEFGAIAAAFAAGLGYLVRNAFCAYYAWKCVGVVAAPFAPFIGAARIEAAT